MCKRLRWIIQNDCQQIAKTQKGQLAYIEDCTRNEAHQIIDLAIMK
jgi:hypothetical protein